MKRIDFDAIDINKIDTILATGDVAALPAPEQEYYRLMEMVRGLQSRVLMPGGKRVATKAAIIKLIKQSCGLSDYMVRRLYDDTLNFFRTDSAVNSKAWKNLYAEKLENMANLAFSQGRFKDGRSLMADAAKLRGCFDDDVAEIPDELLQQKSTVVYTTDAAALGAPAANRRELEAFIDSLPEVPVMTVERIKEDAGIKKKNLLKRMMDDAKEFSDDQD